MQTATLTWTATIGWSPRPLPLDADPVLYFGDRAALADGPCHTAQAPGSTVRHIGFHALGEIAPPPVSGDIQMRTQIMTPPLLDERGA